MIKFLNRLVVLLLFFAPFIAQAQAFGPQLTYHGRILDTQNANAPVSGTVQFLMQIVHPDVPTCVLYQETQSQNLTAADGNFTLTVNGGSSTLPAALLNPFADVFITDATRTINCINGGTVPGTVNSRKLNVFFVPPGGTAYEPLPSQAINYVPLAIEALNTNAVGGFGAPSLLRVIEINGFGVPIPYAVPAITRPLYEELDATIKGNSSYYVTSQGTVAYFSTPLIGEVTGVQSATVVSRIMGKPLNAAGGTLGGGEVMFYDGTNWIPKPGIDGTVKTVTSTNPYLTVTGGPPSNDPTVNPLLTVNVGQVANTVAAGNDPRIVNAFQTTTPLVGDVTGLVSATVVSTVGGKTAAQVSQSVSDTIAATSANTAGTIVKRDGSGNVTVNTLSATNTSTRNVLLYNATNTQYATINAPAALAVSYVLTLPSTLPVSGFVLATDGNGTTSWISPTTGSVTNVSATAPLASSGGFTPTISITRSSETVDGYLAATDFLSFNSRIASVTVTTPLTLGGTSLTPIIGLQNSGVSAGTYTKFTVDIKGIITSATTLLPADIPDLDTSKITTGIFPIQRGGTGTNALTATGFVAVDASGTALTSTACAANEVPYYNGTAWACRLASSANSSATLVMRDANGDFTANNITTVQDMTVQRNLRVQDGMVGGYIGLTTPVGVGSYDIVLPNNAVPPGINQVLAVNSATSATVATTWITALTDALASGTIYVGNASGTATPVILSGDATITNTGNLQLIGIGNGVVSGSEYTKVTVDSKGRVTSGSQLNNADVVAGLGYVPMNSVSAATPVVLTGGASNPVISFADSGVASGSYGSNTLIPIFTVDQWGRITSATSTVYADATGASKGIVQVGSNITVTAGTISVTSANVIAAMGTLGGDVSGTLDATVVQTVGGKTAAQISQSVSDTIAATDLNSSGTIVKRDANGNFTANNITTVQDMTVQRNLRVQDGLVGGFIGLTTPVGVASYDIVLPSNAVAPTVNQVLAVATGTSSTVTTAWINALTDVLASGAIIVGNASGTATPVIMTGDATLTNTGNLQLIGIGTGVVSGTQYTKVTVDSKGRVTSGAQLNNADVVSGLGYVPMNTVSTTTPLSLTGGASNPTISLDFSGVASGAYGSNTLIPNFIVDQWGRITSATTTVYADATNVTKGIVQIGSNITLSTGVISVTSANVIAAMGALGGDVSGTLDATVVQTVGGKTAAQISQSVSDTITATHLNSSGTIVKRDNNGNFTANNITTVQDMTVQRNLRVQDGMVGGYIGLTTPIGVTSYDIVLPNNAVAPNVGQVLSVNSATSSTVTTTWINALTDSLNPGWIFVGNASGTATGVAMTGDATMSNTGNFQLINVGAGVTSGSQYTKVTVDGKGRITSATQLASSDVVTALGYTPADDAVSGTYVRRANNLSDLTNSATARTNLGLGTFAVADTVDLGSASATGIIADARLLDWTNVTSGTQYTKVTVDGKGRVTSGAQLNNADVVAGLGFAPMASVSSTSPITLSGGASNPVIGLAFSGITSGTYPKVTVDDWGRVTSGSGLSFADVTYGLGYTPVVVVSATAPIVLTGSSSSPVINLANSGVTAGSYGSNTLIPNFIVDQWGRITSATTTVYADATSSAKGIVQIGSNITVTAGTISVTSANVIAAMGTLGGDVSGTLDATVVQTVGGKTAAQISQSVSDTIAATHLNSSGTIVKRDNNGDFTANNITTVQDMTVQRNLRVQNGMANYIGITTPIATPSYDIVLPNNAVAPNVGQVLSVSTATSSTVATTWINALTDSLTSGYIFVGNASGTATGMAMTGDATISNTGNFQLINVGSGVTSGSQYTKVTVDGKGRIISGTQLNNADVVTALGYTPADDAVSGTYVRRANNLSDLTNSATARTNLGLGTFAVADTVDLGSASATGIIADARLLDWTNVASGTQYTKVTVDGKGRVTSGAQLNNADVVAGLGFAPMASVSSTSPITLSGGASNPVIGLAFSGITSGTYPKVTVDDWGRVTSGSNLSFADVTYGLGYTPVVVVSATAPIVLTGSSSSPVINLANSGVTAGSYGSNTLIPNFIVDQWGRITSATTTVYADATNASKGIVQIGSNITLSTGTISITSANVIAAMGTLGGDVSGTLDATVVQTVGGKTAAQISQSVSDTIAATHLNSSGTIVKRDNNGNFIANNITTVQDMTVQRNLRIQDGSVGGYIGLTTPVGVASYDIVLPNNAVAPNVGQVLSVAAGTSSTVTTAWINALTDSLTSGYIFVGNASGTATGVAMTGDATMSNTGNFQLINVGAGVTSGSQYTKVTVDGKGRVTSATQLNNADVVTALGYTPADDAVSGTYVRRANNLSDLTNSATARTNLGLGTFAVADTVDLGSASATGIIADARLLDWTNVASGTQYTKVTVDGKGRVTSGAQLNNADVVAGLGFAPMASVSSTSPITLSGGASNPVIGLAFSGITSGTYPKVTVDDWGRVTSGSGLSLADVTYGLGYTPVSLVSATAPIVLTGSASNPVIALANSGVTAGTYGSNTLIPSFIIDAWGRITSATAAAYADATGASKGIVQIGSNITLSTGTISITSANVIAAMGTLGGDVSGTLDATVVQTVGGKTAAQISQSVSDTIAATHLNSSGTIVKRDNNGDFTANNITTVQDMTVQRNLRVQNGMANYIGITTPIATPSYDIVLPNNTVVPTVGQVLAVATGSTSSVISTYWVNSLTNSLPSAYILVGNASGTASGVAMTGDATISNTGVLTFASVGAGVTSGSQYTKVTVDGKGRVTSAAQLDSADVVTALGYTPADDAVSGTYVRRANNLSDLTNSATARTNLGLGTFATANTVDLGSASATGIIADARLLDWTNIVSGTVYSKVTVDGKGRVTSGAQLSNADINTALGYAPMASVSSTSPITLTGGASNPVIGLAFSGITSGTYPKVTVDDWGRVTSGSNLSFADVTYGLGYTPVVAVSATAPIVLTGSSSSPVINLANSGVTAGAYGSNTLIPSFIVDAWGRITSATTSAYADATNVTKGIVQIGSNITLSSGVISVTSGNVIAAVGALGGDVSGTLDATVVQTVGGKTSAQISQSVSDTIAATHLNSSGTIVKRDNNGDFTANNITTVQDMTVQRNLRVQNGMANYIGITTPIATPSYDIVLPNNTVAPTVGQILSVASGSTGTTILTRWVNSLSDVLPPSYIFVGDASGVATGVPLTGDATIANSGAITLASVGAGVTSGSQYTKVTVDGKGRVTSGGQLASTDVITALGFTPADDAASGTYVRRANNLSDLTNSATARTNLGLGTFATANTVDLGSASATGIIADARLLDWTNVTSGTQYTKVTVDGKGRVTSGAQLNNADVVAGLGYTPMNTVSSTSPITLTGGASNPVIGLANSGVTAATYPKVTVDAWGRVTSGSNLSFADVTYGLGYTPVEIVSAASPLVISGAASSPVLSLANSGVTAGSYGTSTGIPFFTVDNWGRITSAGTQAYADATAGAKGIVQVGANITVTAGTISITSGNVIAALGGNIGGDVTGTLPAMVVVSVGGKTAAQISQSVSDTIAATHLNSSGTIVKRDNNGDFTANNITTVQDMTVQRNLRVQNGMANYIGITTPIATPSYDIVLPNNAVAPNVGQVLSVNSATSAVVTTTWVNALTDALASSYIYVGNASGSAQGVAMTGDATINNTGVLTLSGVGAGVTSGSQYTKVTVDGKGRVTSGGQLASSDVIAALGYTPSGMVSSTAPITISGAASTTVIGLANSGVTAGTYGSSFTMPIITVDALGRLTSVASQTLRVADSVNPGVVSVGSNLTVNGAGSISVTSGNVVAALGYTPVNQAGDTMTGGLTTPSLVVSNTVAVGTAAVTAGSMFELSSTSLGMLIPRMSTAQRNLIALGAPQNGLQIYNTSVGSLEFYDSASGTWKTVATNSSAVISLNGSTSATQIFTTGSAGTSFNVVTTNGDHTFNMPMAASAGVTQGALSNTQFQTFTDKVTAVSGVAGEITITGAVSSPVVGLANSGITAGTYGSSSTMAVVTYDSRGRATGVTSSTLRLASAAETGVVQVGNNISVTAGTISITSGNVIAALGANLSGDVTGSLSATVVASVGGKTSAQISQSVSDTLAATDANSSGTIVRRDANGNFVANNITTVQDMTVQRYLRVQNGIMGNSVGIFVPMGSPDYDIILPNSASVPPPGYGLGIQSATATTVQTAWVPMMNSSIAAGTFYVGNASGVATAVAMSGDATMSSSGVVTLANVGAGITSGSQYAKVTVDGKGRVTSGSGLNNADVVAGLGYTPMNSVSSTSPITVTGGASNPVIGFANSGVTAATYGSSFTMPVITVDAFGRITSVASQTLRVADATNPGVVSVGANITVNGAGSISLTAANVVSALTYTPVNKAGDTMTGALTVPSVVVSNTLAINTAAVAAGSVLDITSTTGGILIPRMTTAQRNAITVGAAQNGLQIYNTSTGAIEYYDHSATAWKQVVTNFSAMTSLNGSVSSTQTFAIGSAGTALNFVTTNGVHTLNLPMAASAGVTQGAITAAQYTSFNDKVTSVTAVTGQLVVTGTTSSPTVGLANSGVTAATYGSSFTIPTVTVDAFGRITAVASQTLRVADASSTGVVSIGSNITVNGAGQISLTAANVASALTYTPVNKAGDTMTGTLTAPSLVGTTMVASTTLGVGTAAVAAGSVVDITSTTGGILIPRMTTAQRNAIASGAAQNGLQIYNTSTGAIEYYDHSATAWKQVVTNFSALTSLNGSASSTQTFAIGSAGTALNFVTTNGVHTLNLPMAASAGVTQGALTNTQYQSFVDKVTSVSAAAGQIVITGGTSSPVVGLANSGVTAATYGSSFTIPTVTVDIYGRITSVASQTLRVADASNTGVVSIGSNITVNGAGQISLTSANVLSAFGANLGGDVTGSLSATTVATVGGKTSAQVSQSVSDTLNATSANTASTIVKRDGNGDFVSRYISILQNIFRDSGANTITMRAPAAVTASYTFTLPASAGTAGMNLTTDGSGATGWAFPQAGAQACPAGMTLVAGDPNNGNLGFCIDTNASAATALIDYAGADLATTAITACGMQQKRLCTMREIVRAKAQSAAIGGPGTPDLMTDQWFTKVVGGGIMGPSTEVNVVCWTNGGSGAKILKGINASPSGQYVCCR